jgi:hypothetical protein
MAKGCWVHLIHYLSLKLHDKAGKATNGLLSFVKRDLTSSEIEDLHGRSSQRYFWGNKAVNAPARIRR